MTIAKGKTFRLTDILTKEVSLVDHAANKRVFLVRKNEGDEQELVSDGKGGFVVKDGGGASEPQKGEPAPQPEKSPEVPPPSPPPEVDPKPDPAQEPKEEPAEKISFSKSTLESIVKVVEQLTALAQKAGSADKDEGEVEEAILSAIAPIVKAEERVPLREDGAWKSSALLQKELKLASAKLVEVADSLAVDTSDNPPPIEVRWRITDVLDSLVEFTRFEVAQAAMAKAEAAEFRALATGLASALGKELAEPSIERGSAMQLLNVASETVKALTAQIKKQDARIRTLEAEPQPSRRIPVDTQDAPRSQDSDVVWPYDMNEKRYPKEEDLSFV